MKAFAFIPLKSIGEVVFGESRENVRHKLGAFQEFKKTNRAKNTTDDFGFCHAYYDVEDKCEAIEFVRNETSVMWEDRDIYAYDYKTLEQFVASHDDALDIDSSGFISKKLQLAVYSPDKETIQAILFAREGYYD